MILTQARTNEHEMAGNSSDLMIAGVDELCYESMVLISLGGTACFQVDVHGYPMLSS